MPSIFRTIARAMQGQPLFDQNEAQQNNQEPTIDPFGHPVAASNPQPTPQAQQPPQADSQEPTINRSDSRTFPVVRIKHSATRIYNGQMEVRGRIINESPFTVDVHKAEMLDTVTDIKCPLGPGQEREFLLYHGPCMHDDRDHDMSIEYKAETGAYFKALHDIKYQINADRSYTIDELRLRQPIHFVAG